MVYIDHRREAGEASTGRTIPKLEPLAIPEDLKMCI